MAPLVRFFLLITAPVPAPTTPPMTAPLAVLLRPFLPTAACADSEEMVSGSLVGVLDTALLREAEEEAEEDLRVLFFSGWDFATAACWAVAMESCTFFSQSWATWDFQPL